MKRFAIISFYSKGRGKSSTKVVKKPASPPKTSADVDLDNGFAAQCDRMLGRCMIGWNFYLRLYYVRLDPVLTILNLITYIQRTLQRFLGQSGVQTVPEPPQPHDKSASVRSRERLVCEGGTGARLSGLA